MRDAGGSNLVGPRGVVSRVIPCWVLFSGDARLEFSSATDLSGLAASET